MAESFDDIVRDFHRAIKELTEAAKEFEDAAEKAKAANDKATDLARQLLGKEDSDTRNRLGKAQEKLRQANKRKDDAKDALEKARTPRMPPAPMAK